MLSREGKTRAEIFPTVSNERITLERRFLERRRLVGENGIGRYPNTRGCSNTSTRVEPRKTIQAFVPCIIYARDESFFYIFL